MDHRPRAHRGRVHRPAPHAEQGSRPLPERERHDRDRLGTRRERVHVEIDVASVHSGSSERDEQLRSADLFDVANHPLATFRSTEIRWTGTTGTMHGNLTIKGITRAVQLDVTYAGAIVDPWGNERLAFSARTRLNREDWSVGWNMPLGTGGMVVSKEIDIEIEIEATRDA